MTTNIQPVKTFSGSQILDFSQREISRISGVAQGALKKPYTVFVRAAVSPEGYIGLYWRDGIARRLYPFCFRIVRLKVIISASKITADLIKWTRGYVFVRTDQGRLVAAT